MGKVWYGLHSAEGAEVAIKVMDGSFAADPLFRAAFRNEVRAVASLDHPHIVTVHDYGEVDEEAAARSEGALTAGSPWLVMELAAGGTLVQWGGSLRWGRLRRILLGLLDALAHAHARGVLHRDLKPANVLLPAGSGGHVILTDFGLAHALDSAEGEPFQGGTPSYMAPEQFTSHWRDYGPWTDLYALGCLAWALIKGRAPFPASTFEAVRRAHLFTTPPPLDARLSLPLGFEAWLRRTMHKDGARRYLRAADAAADLVALGNVPDGDDDDTPGADAAWVLPTLGEASTLLRRPDPSAVTLVHTRPDPRAHAPDTRLPLDGIATPPKLPPDWRRPWRRRRRLHTAGIGLFGLRTIPLVDREEERTALWAQLHRVLDEGLATMAVLHGPAGSGKSRLAEWVCQRAHEAGAAQAFRATFDPTGGEGLGAIADRALRCFGLQGADLDKRLAHLLPDEDIGALHAVLRGGGRFRDPAERYAVLVRILDHTACGRVVILWLDDAHYGADALRFARWVLDHRHEFPLPLYLVATAVAEEIATRPIEQALLAELVERPETLRIEVGPLPPEHRPALVRELLGLDGELAGRVEARTDGNPLFAVQLVGVWVQRGLLIPGPRGFKLREGAEVALPQDLHGVWAARIERVLAHVTWAEARGLEIAAVLGQEVDVGEWNEACTLADAVASTPLLEFMLDQRLLRPVGPGLAQRWSFAHGLLREVLVQRAADAHRLDDHHAVCARLLQRRVHAGRAAATRSGPATREVWPPGFAERVGRHLMGAGNHAEALAPLLHGAEERRRSGDYEAAADLVATRERSLARLGVPEADPRWGAGWLLRAEAARGRADWEEISAWLDRVEEHAHLPGWEDLAARAGCQRGGWHRIRGDLARAKQVLREVEKRASTLGDQRLMARIRWELGSSLSRAGEHREAEFVLSRSLDNAREAGDLEGVGNALQALAELVKDQGRHGEALERLTEARERHRDAGNLWGVASAINSLGDVNRYRGDLEEAEACYAEAERLFARQGSDSALFPAYNHGLLLLELDRVAEARPLLEQALRGFLRKGGKAVLGDCHLALAACDCADGRFPLAVDHLEQARAMLEEMGAADEDTARVAELAARQAQRKGQPDVGRIAWEIALYQWTALGRQAEAAAVRVRLAR